MATEVNGFDDNDARRISDTVAIVLGTQSAQGSAQRPSDVQLSVVTSPIDLLRELKWMTSQFDVTAYTLDGDEWFDEKLESKIRLVTNGKQIALPVPGVGLCFADSEFWAVNIGTLSPATHPLTGHATGRAAVLDLNQDGDLVITDKRLDFVRRDASGEIADGTLITLGYVHGSLTIKWADCTAHEDLTGLVADPEEDP